MIDEKSYQKDLVYSILYKTLIGAKPLRIGFDKVHGVIRVYDRTRYLILFEKKYRSIFDRIRYLIGGKSSITYGISQNNSKLKVDSYDSFPLQKMLIFHNVIMHIK